MMTILLSFVNLLRKLIELMQSRQKRAADEKAQAARQRSMEHLLLLKALAARRLARARAKKGKFPS